MEVVVVFSSFLLIMDLVFQMDVPTIQYVPSSSGRPNGYLVTCLFMVKEIIESFIEIEIFQNISV